MLSVNVILFSFCFAKKKVAKKKAILGERLRPPKKALRCWRTALVNLVALVFCLSLATIKPINRVSSATRLSFINRIYGKKEAPSYARLYYYYQLQRNRLTYYGENVNSTTSVGLFPIFTTFEPQ